MLTSEKLNGHLEVIYQDGYLISTKIEVKHRLSELQFDHFFRLIPYQENNIEKFHTLGLTVEKVIELPANKKIALFCELYEKYNGIKYSASRMDGGKIKQIRIDEAMLTHYFESANFLFKNKHSIANLVRYYNELKLEMSTKGKAKHPNKFDLDYIKRLDGHQLADYWKHLRDLGLQPKKDRFGNVIDWN